MKTASWGRKVHLTFQSSTNEARLPRTTTGPRHHTGLPPHIVLMLTRPIIVILLQTSIPIRTGNINKGKRRVTHHTRDLTMTVSSIVAEN